MNELLSIVSTVSVKEKLTAVPHFRQKAQLAKAVGGAAYVGANVTEVLWQNIYRERRRLAFVTLMAFFAGFLFYLRADFYLGGVHIAIVTGTVYAVVVGLSALIVCLVLPSMRFMIESVAVSRLFLSFFVLAAPEVGYKILASPMMTAFLVVLGGAFISRILHGRSLRDRSPGWRSRVLPSKGMFHRAPAQFVGKNWQNRFVSWVDGAVPAAS